MMLMARGVSLATCQSTGSNRDADRPRDALRNMGCVATWYFLFKDSLLKNIKVMSPAVMNELSISGILHWVWWLLGLCV